MPFGRRGYSLLPCATRHHLPERNLQSLSYVVF